MRSPASDSRSGRMNGMPPATAASNSRSTPASSAANSSAPTLASRLLFPVTTGLPAFRAARISSRAGSIPPITSTTTSMSGSTTRPRRPGEDAAGQLDRPLAGQAAHRHPGHLQAQPGAGGDVVAAPPDQLDQGGTDVAAAQQADADGFGVTAGHGTAGPAGPRRR